MARICVKTREDAERVASVMTDLHGYQPSIFKDGDTYVVQHNDLRQEAVEEALYDRGLWKLLDREVVDRIEWERTQRGLEDMTEEEFAEALGFESYEDLMEASEAVIREGDIYWYVTRLPNGRWVAWDEAELSLSRTAYFATYEEAAEFHRDAYGYTLSLDDFLTKRDGHEAVRLPWDEVEALLGGYDGTEEDDEKLIDALSKMTAAKGWPKWIDDPAARKIVTDDAGWWLVGPEVDEEA